MLYSVHALSHRIVKLQKELGQGRQAAAAAAKRDDGKTE
jgi:hypothetical protein